ncbi:flagellar hook protein FlgE [Pigmentiphaga aceris]|uniref:Flagellar hook protein FlgE n=1 Tax=Pigmentiphaga aceris TaxID=1940612 RepID=A0A5C0AXN2_9BURK|nr:flagellar hook protein FlgE [Pigmentiphaga aceris]QEI07219.1 flagellar hook protein FlgE [Pigmentiphaga aceris]
MSFQQALSGLNAASKNLDVIGNNVANVNTIGFKASRAEFADVFASTLAGSVSNTSAGIGTRVASVSQTFSQGGISISDRPLDVAINGEGFFRMDDNGSVVYSRNGQFKADKDGFLVNSSNGLKLTGYGVDNNGNVLTSAPVPLRLTVDTINPRVTARAEQGVNLDSRVAPIATLTPPTSATPGPVTPKPFDPLDTSTFTKATSLTVFDTLGNSHVLTTYYRKVQPEAALVNGEVQYSGDVKWEVYAGLDGKITTGTPPVSIVGSDAGALADPATGKIAELKFNSSGKPLLADTGADFNPTLTIKGAGTDDVLNNGAADIEFLFDMSATTQYGQIFGINVQDQDGYTSGELTGYSIGADGIVQARYSNEQTRAQGQIVLATFKSPQGLSSLGNNLFAETGSSGGPRVGEPGSSNIGSLQSGALEEANIDLTSELVNMITAQRAYQANSQTIKTQDSIMQTLVNLR